MFFKVDVVSRITVQIFFPPVLGLELRAFTSSHSTSPVFVKGFFGIGSCGTICPGWLRTTILLISVS
jgi:hypothetical protein